MSEKMSNKDIELLHFYQKKKRNKKIIIAVILFIALLVCSMYICYCLQQANWDVKSSKVAIEYGENYQPALDNLVDLKKYSFITPKNTQISSNVKNEDNKEYTAIGEYQVKLIHKGTIKIFGITKNYEDEKDVAVVVKDTTAPTIEPPEVIEMLVGEPLDMSKYVYLFKVTDLSKTKELQLNADDVNNNLVGNYTIVATVEDIYGNKQTCKVPCSVIEDPYGDIVPVSTTEPTTVQTTQATTTTTTQPETTKKVTTTAKKQTVTTSKNAKKKKSSSSSYKSKDFLFEDGYTMANVSDVATDYLRKSGKAGECVPLKDADGIYIGMRVIIYD